MSDCIFCKLVNGTIPCDKLYEDDELIAFHDIHPIAPVHFLIIPKIHIVSLADGTESHELLLGRMLRLGVNLAHKQGLKNGFRTMINTDKGGGQEVFHLHFHFFGGSSTLPKI